MTLLIVGLLLFLGIHSVSIVAPAWRDAQLAQRGESAWKGMYSVAAGVGLGLIIYGYGLARQAPVVLYTPPAALRHVALLLLLPVFVLLLAAYLPGRIKTAAKHPMLLATKLWAAGAPAGQRQPGRRAAVRWLSRLGRGRPHFAQAPAGAGRAGCAGRASERCDCGRGRAGAVLVFSAGCTRG